MRIAARTVRTRSGNKYPAHCEAILLASYSSICCADRGIVTGAPVLLQCRRAQWHTRTCRKTARRGSGNASVLVYLRDFYPDAGSLSIYAVHSHAISLPVVEFYTDIHIFQSESFLRLLQFRA